MYEVEDHRYCYRGTFVLKNRENLRTDEDLTKFETLSVTQRAEEPLPKGKLSVKYYRALHRHLFQDVYTWAGRPRTIRISKSGSMFCYPENIDAQLRSLFLGLASENEFRDLEPEVFARRAAHFLAELNAIHPFREGNGRTQTTFLSVLADQAGHPLDLERMEADAMMLAMIASFRGDEGPLISIIHMLMRSAP